MIFTFYSDTARKKISSLKTPNNASVPGMSYYVKQEPTLLQFVSPKILDLQLVGLEYQNLLLLQMAANS